jgi:small subunit ribosomal protein S6
MVFRKLLKPMACVSGRQDRGLVKPREYELVVVISPALDEDETKGTIDRIHGLITGAGGELVKEEEWGMRRLAYPIKDFTEGSYFLTEFTTDPQQTRPLEDAIGLSEDILRHLLIRIEN